MIDEGRLDYETTQYAKFHEKETEAIEKYWEWRKNREPYEKDGRWPFKSLSFFERIQYKLAIFFASRQRAPITPKKRSKVKQDDFV